ncbi:Hypothetical protein, putative [Bodo saltans]|uniref:Uncharacterized protein n=1 Tax=Bodo saltans TaxID=75058 RepID=A0A0S4IY93_BODSA|nr:Hypothetical protein, putative [Bodo saltans]|eukprot:CUG07993.1 Hypothetical protein, putative [Bodo saltans]
MDKEKTMEFLRGMKFMQRKEEAKRRESHQAQQGASFRQQTAEEGAEGETPQAASSSPLSSGNGPTIIAIQGSAGVSLGFRTAAPRRMKFSGGASTQIVSAPKEDVVSTLRQLEHEQGDDQEALPLSLQDVTATVSDNGSGAAPRRFVVSSSVRAPVMPKGLARQVGQDAARKKRDRDQEGDDYSDPRMRF